MLNWPSRALGCPVLYACWNCSHCQYDSSAVGFIFVISLEMWNNYQCCLVWFAQLFYRQLYCAYSSSPCQQSAVNVFFSCALTVLPVCCNATAAWICRPMPTVLFICETSNWRVLVDTCCSTAVCMLSYESNCIRSVSVYCACQYFSLRSLCDTWCSCWTCCWWLPYCYCWPGLFHLLMHGHCYEHFWVLPLSQCNNQCCSRHLN